MIKLTNIHSLSDFQRNARDHIDRLKSTGLPEVLTGNGHAEVVVQSAAAYQRMLDQIDLADSTRILRERIASADAGTPGIPAKKVLEVVRERLRKNKP